MSRMRPSPADEQTLNHRLQWHAGQCLRRGVGCSVIVLQPLRHQDHQRVCAFVERSGEHEDPPTTLQQVAARLRQLLRQTDLIEVEDDIGIGVLLRGADSAGAHSAHRRISQALTTSSDPVGAKSASLECVQLAVGLATVAPSPTGRIPALVREMIAIASVPDQSVAVPLVRHTPPVHAWRRRQAQTAGRAAARTHATSVGLHALPALASADPAGEETDRLRARADALGVPYVTLPARVPESLHCLVGTDVLRELRAVPIGRTRGMLTVAMLDPTDIATIQRLAAATGLTIFPVLASTRDLARTLE